LRLSANSPDATSNNGDDLSMLAGGMKRWFLFDKACALNPADWADSKQSRSLAAAA